MQCCMVAIPECSKGTKKYDQAKQDLTNVISTVSHVTIKSLHKIFVTASVWGNIRNLLNGHILY